MTLAVDHIRFAYRGAAPVLDDVSLTVDKGDILCLLGPNGTGKTTLLRCLLGFSRPQRGSVVVDGCDVTRLAPRRRARLLAYVPQSSVLAFPYEVLDVVLMGRVAHLPMGASHTQRDCDIAAECLDRLRIGHLARRRYQDLSGGEKQMALVARALAQQADYLVMDEPTANLDYHNQVRILSTIRELTGQGYGILMTSHFPDHAFLACSKAVLMRDGGILDQGAPEGTVTTENLSVLYSTPVCVSEADVFGQKTKVCVPVLDSGCR